MYPVKYMWRKTVRKPSPKPLSMSAFLGTAAILLSFWGFAIFPNPGNAQNLASSGRDPTTQRSLEELQQILDKGTPQEIRERMQLIINGSGYIEPLAEVYMWLASKETDGAALIADYSTIIDKWPKSARAQQALLSLVPLIIMSGGEWGEKEVALIWNNQNDLLAPAPDSANLGENPEDLRADVFIQLLRLAHYRKDSARITVLLALTPPRASQYQDQIDLAAAFAKGYSGDRTTGRAAFLGWVNQYANSNYRPLALWGLYQASEQENQLNEALALFKPYQDSLEALLLKDSVGQGLQ